MPCLVGALACCPFRMQFGQLILAGTTRPQNAQSAAEMQTIWPRAQFHICSALQSLPPVVDAVQEVPFATQALVNAIPELSVGTWSWRIMA